MRLTCAHEFWRFIGITIAAGPEGKGGLHLFEKEEHQKVHAITGPINCGIGGLNLMPCCRFNEIQAVFLHAFEDKAATLRDDPWSMVGLMVDVFNKNREEKVAASSTKVMDDVGSAAGAASVP